MAVHEGRRAELFERLSAMLGQEAARTLGELLPPLGEHVATSGDVAALRADMRSEFSRLRDGTAAEFARLRDETTGEFARVRTEVAATEHRLVAMFERRISDAVTSQTRTLVLSQLGALVAIAALAFGLR